MIKYLLTLILCLMLISVCMTRADTGLDFPGTAATTIRFKFANPHLNGLPIYGTGGAGVTYIWKAYPRQKALYYTTFFWGNDDGNGSICPTFHWVGSCNDADTYYGAHPYPDWQGGSLWEIAVERNDYTNGAVVPNRWYTQALRVWSDGSGKHHIFYWDLPYTDSSHIVSRISPTSYGNTNPPSPTLTWGDAPWNPGNEIYYGILRGIQIYSSLLSVSDMISESTTPLSTSAGAANIWYLNTNPTPSDISDKSGKGHNPAWVGSGRPTLYTSGESPSAPKGFRITD
jgi:hypothetical protein